MSAATSRDARKVVGFVLCLALAVGAQGVTATTRSAEPSGAATAAVGRTGFAYLGGLRRFAAAVLWNRLDPQSHEYYADTPFSKQTHMMPTFHIVTLLDPQFEQAYYLASWLAWENISREEGISIARDGLAENPESGMLVTNLIQLLFIEDARVNKPEIEVLVARILGGELRWLDDETYFEGLAVSRDALGAYGRTAEAAAVTAEMERLRESGIGTGDHDHDGDGEQDH